MTYRDIRGCSAYIGEVRVYDRVLTAADVRERYLSTWQKDPSSPTSPSFLHRSIDSCRLTGDDGSLSDRYGACPAIEIGTAAACTAPAADPTRACAAACSVSLPFRCVSTLPIALFSSAGRSLTNAATTAFHHLSLTFTVVLLLRLLLLQCSSPLTRPVNPGPAAAACQSTRSGRRWQGTTRSGCRSTTCSTTRKKARVLSSSTMPSIRSRSISRPAREKKTRDPPRVR